MTRASWLPAIAALAALSGFVTSPAPSPSGDIDAPWAVPQILDEARAPHAVERGAAVPELAEEDWQPPPKAPAMDFLAEQGGLWRTDVPYDAGGRLRTVPGTVQAPGEAERVATVRVEVETGLGADSGEFARQVMSTLNDPRGWGHDGSVAFARTDGAADIEVTLASPATTDELCAPLATVGEVSCGRVGFAVLNAARWAQGAQPFLEAGGTVAEYRHYLVNHEVGHVLGHGHVSCADPGELAPVMLQQTLRLEGCVPNGWPAPSPAS